LKRGIEIQPRLWQNHYFLAQIEVLRGNLKKAKEFLHTAIEFGGVDIGYMAREDPNLKGLMEASSSGT
jgi:hypothetical protein